MVQAPRLLANVIDDKARTVPNSPYLLYSQSTAQTKEGIYKTITWKQFANAINKAAQWLDETIPRPGSGRQTIAYSGANDARYYILIAAAAKSGRTLFIPDGRITPDGLATILEEIQCTAWLYTHGVPSAVEKQQSVLVPELDDFLSSDDTPPYPYEESWEKSRDEIVCIIHTSGTTGVPKPIYLRNGYLSVWDSWNTIMAKHSRQITYRHMVNALTVNVCAPQWLAGLAFSLAASAFVGLTTVMLPPDMTAPFDPQLIMQICQNTGANSIASPPSLIEEFYNDEKARSFLKNLDYITYVGAGLNHAVGDDLAKHTHLFPVIGSTERGACLSFEPEEASMWKTFDFVPEMGCRFEQVQGDQYEMHIDRTAQHKIFQGGFYSFPHLDSIDTAELYSPVTSKDGSRRWISCGRRDDLVKLSWLAKFHATHIEDNIAMHANIGGVFVGGEGREVPYIIIEPKNHSCVGDPEGFIDKIYKVAVEDANQRDDDEIRIPRETVMLADATLPFKRTAKMTLLRKEIERDYQHHIEELYQRRRMVKAA